MIFPLSPFSEAELVCKESCNTLITALKADGRAKKKKKRKQMIVIMWPKYFILLLEYILNICEKEKYLLSQYIFF